MRSDGFKLPDTVEKWKHRIILVKGNLGLETFDSTGQRVARMCGMA